MPVIPGPDQIQRTVIQPGGRVSQYQGGVAEDAAARAAQTEGQSAAGVFRAVGGLASQVTDMADKELDRIEGLKVAEAVTKNRQQTLVLTQNYKNTRGGDAVTATGYLKTHMDAYEQQSASISGTLTTDRQREAFKQAADSERVGYSSGLMEHVFSETDKYGKLVLDASLATDRAVAASDYKNPKKVSASVANTTETVSKILVHEGITDPKARAMAMLGHTGAVHSAVIDAALENQDPEYASGYLEENKAAMTPEQVRAISARVKPAIEYAEAVGLSDKAEQMRVAGKSSAEIQSYIDHAAKSQISAGLAKDILHAQDRARKNTAEDVAGGMVTKFVDAGASEAAALAMRRSPDFHKIDPAEQGPLYNRLRQEGIANDARGLARSQEKWDSLDVNMRFLEAIGDPNLISKSENQIQGLLLTLGPAKTKQVMSEYMSQKSGVAKFNISKEILNDGLPLDLREHRGTASGEAKRQEHIAAFKGLVESGLQTFKETQKRTPSDAEQAAIVLAARRDIVTKGEWWRFGVVGKETPIYELPKEQRDALSAADRKAAIASQARSMSESEFKARLSAQAKREGKSPSQATLDSAWNKFNKGK